jgi:hypothetical protein
MKIIFLVTLIGFVSCSALEQYKTKEPKPAESINEKFDYEKLKIHSKDFPISKILTDQEYISKFKKSVCKHLSEKECDLEYSKMVHERMHSEYKVSTVDNSKAWCRPYPVECMDIKVVEAYYILSWNQYLDGLKEQNLRPIVYPSILGDEKNN